MPDIFISYSRQDQAVARHFAEGFEQEGLGVWWDQAINPGEAFDQVTEQALEEARAVVVLWSKTSVSSRWVRAEATQANANGRLVPVMIEPCRRPIIFELSHTVDLSHWQGDRDDPGWKAFAASVRRVVERNAQAAPGAATATITATATPPASRPSAGPSTAPAAPSYRESKPAPHAKIPGASPAAPERRKALLYGASAVGIAAVGFAGGKWLAAPTSGGKVAAGDPPAFRRLTFRRGLIRNACFGPDSQTIYYGALWDGHPCRVFSTRTDNPESRAFDLPRATVLAVSRTGELALALGDHREGVFTYGTLARVPISGGAPRELAEDVKFADWSPDGTQLAAIRTEAGVDRLEYPLGTVIFQTKRGEGTGLGFVRISPDGRRIAFGHYRNRGSLIGKLCVITDGKLEVLTDESVNLHGVAWRGDQLLFTASEDVQLLRSLFLLEAPGAAPRVIARLPVNMTLWDIHPDGRLLIAQTDDRGAMIARVQGSGSETDLSWLDASGVSDISIDGKFVLFSETGQGVGNEFTSYMRGLDGSPAIRLGRGIPLALSPDARFALIRSDAPAPEHENTLLDVVPTGAGEARRVPGPAMRHHGARWLANGRSLIVGASLKEQRARLYRLDLPDMQPIPISPQGVGDWAISPDDSTVAAFDAEGKLWLHPVREGTPRVLPKVSGNQSLFGWINDGMLVMRLDDPASPLGEVYLLDPGTGRTRSWTNILPRDAAGIMAMGFLVTTPDGRVRVFSWHRALSNLYLATGL